MVFEVSDPEPCGPDTLPDLSLGSGGCSSFIHAFSRILVHLPLLPAWLCFRCWRKWSARKNFFALLHSPNLCTVVKCSNRRSQSGRGKLGNSSPQYPHESCEGPALVWQDGEAEPWKAAWKLGRAAQDQEWRRRCREFWCRSASFLFLKRLLQYWQEYCFSIS